MANIDYVDDIFNLLKKKEELTIKDIKLAFNITQQCASYYVEKMMSIHPVVCTKRNQTRFFSIKTTHVQDFLNRKWTSDDE